MNTIHATAFAALTLFATGCTTATVEDHTDPFPMTLSGIVLGEDHEAVEDVELCVFDDPTIPCAEAEEDGRFALALPEGEDVVVTYSAPGHVPALYPHTADADAFRLLTLITAVGYAERFAPLARIDATGTIFVHASGAPFGVEVMLTPNHTPGPVYLDDDLEPEQRGSTGPSGRAAFLEVTAGEHTVEAWRDGWLCEPFGWDQSHGGAAATVEAGYITHVDIWCR